MPRRKETAEEKARRLERKTNRNYYDIAFNCYNTLHIYGYSSYD
jgi:hypothetical protein